MGVCVRPLMPNEVMSSWGITVTALLATLEATANTVNVNECESGLCRNGGVCTDLEANNSYLLVPTKVTGIVTQGAKDFGRVQFVLSYKLAYINDGLRWTMYPEEAHHKDKV
ncbi:hypothetical protein J4Q44_G00137080 [Coregonus suidteri]|uniref:F5/8 type C domain-containing protein n=1 Tax=Coregonus suidteri TaxID=861788 RepID=A0AAN8LTB6_9TELE